jgi:polyhydroxybutyrate depolymerase
MIHFIRRCKRIPFLARPRFAPVMRSKRNVYALAAVAIGVVAALGAQAQVMKFTVDGTQREALIFSPSKQRPSKQPPGQRSPLLFAFHWHGGTMQEAADGMQFQRLWPEAIVVYMQGLRTRIYVDPLGFHTGWQQEPGQFGDRDLKFFDQVLAAIRMKFSVDDDRIYATGFSNGGIFSYLLWGTRGQIFAAFAPVAAQKFPAVQLTIPRPVLHIAGEHDNVVPFKEQLDSIHIARQLDGAGGEGNACGEYCTSYLSPSETPVMTYLHPGGHVYPPGASERIVKFFQENRRKP